MDPQAVHPRSVSRTSYEASQTALQILDRVRVIGATGSEPDRFELAAQRLHRFSKLSCDRPVPDVEPPSLEGVLELTGSVRRALATAGGRQDLVPPTACQRHDDTAENHADDQRGRHPHPR
jgi:hypothetical protein